MPRIPDRLVDAVIYLYPSVDDAQRGTRYGGCGFIVGMPVADAALAARNLVHVYAVSNAHVVRGAPAASVVRFNRPRQGVEPLPLRPEHWVPHPLGDDIAACPVALDFNAVQSSIISTQMMVTTERMERGDFGMGDDCFLLGRYVDVDGRDVGNRPVVRFGNLCRATTELLERDDGSGHQESFLVEVRSLSGFSGSAVFIMPDGLKIDLGDQEPDVALLSNVRRPALLGINWCHLPWKGDVFRGPKFKPTTTDKWAYQNSGMAGVVPAWKIIELLEDDTLKQSRRVAEAIELKKAPPATGVSDVEARPISNAYLRDDFLRDLTKVTEREARRDREA